MSVGARANTMLRAGILRAADDRHVQRFMGRYGMRLGAARFVAGETLDECVVVLRRLAGQGSTRTRHSSARASRDRAEAEAVADEYGRILERLHREQLPCNVALKLTHLGLEHRRGARVRERRARGRDRRAASRASSGSTWSSRASSTRRSRSIAACARPGTTRVGTVLQSYLFRTERDLESLLPLAPNLRFVKGAYLEPPDIAYSR